MNDTDYILKSKVNGYNVCDFFEVIGSRFNLPKPVTRNILMQLHKQGDIKLVMKSPRGARFYVRRRA